MDLFENFWNSRSPGVETEASRHRLSTIVILDRTWHEQKPHFRARLRVTPVFVLKRPVTDNIFTTQRQQNRLVISPSLFRDVIGWSTRNQHKGGVESVLVPLTLEGSAEWTLSVSCVPAPVQWRPCLMRCIQYGTRSLILNMFHKIILAYWSNDCHLLFIDPGSLFGILWWC